MYFIVVSLYILCGIEYGAGQELQIYILKPNVLILPYGFSITIMHRRVSFCIGMANIRRTFLHLVVIRTKVAMKKVTIIPN